MESIDGTRCLVRRSPRMESIFPYGLQPYRTSISFSKGGQIRFDWHLNRTGCIRHRFQRPLPEIVTVFCSTVTDRFPIPIPGFSLMAFTVLRRSSIQINLYG